MGFSVLKKLVSWWPHKGKKGTAQTSKAKLVGAEKPLPKKETEIMKVRMQIISVVGGVALLGS